MAMKRVCDRCEGVIPEEYFGLSLSVTKLKADGDPLEKDRDFTAELCEYCVWEWVIQKPKHVVGDSENVVWTGDHPE